jgi:hypothetical protein
MNNFIAVAIGFFYIGTIDVIEAGTARVILSGVDSQLFETDLPVGLFPCKVSEGDMFYTQVVDGVTEIRCGEPE